MIKNDIVSCKALMIGLLKCDPHVKELNQKMLFPGIETNDTMTLLTLSSSVLRNAIKDGDLERVKHLIEFDLIR